MLTGSPRLLFVAYGGGHVNMVLAVIAAMERLHPKVECLLLALTTGHSKAALVRPVLGYHDFLHLVDADAAKRWGEQLAEGNTSPDVPLEETIAYLGINYLDLIENYGEEGAATYYAEKGRRGFHPGHFMCKVVAELAPDMVIATNSPRSEQAALEAATALGIPSLGMVDLYGLESDSYVTRAHRPAQSCVISEVVRQRLIARGFAPESVHVTGNPAFDGLFSEENHRQAEAFIAEHGWQGLSVILWAGHAEPYAVPDSPYPVGREFPILVEQQLRAFVVSRDDLALIIRYHPSDWSLYPRHAAHSRIHFSETPNEPLHPLVLASRFVVVQTSTVGLEAAVIGKRVVSVEDSPATKSGFSLASLGVSIPCSEHHLLGEVITELMESPQVEVGASAYSSDGKAAEHVVGRIMAGLHEQGTDN